MRRLADSKWTDRLFRKNLIEDALADYTRLMDEAAQSFQVALVAIGAGSRANGIRHATACDTYRFTLCRWHDLAKEHGNTSSFTAVH